MALLMRRFLGTAVASGWIMTIAGGYALHWYYMPPLAYPLHGLNSAMFLTLSVLALERYTERGGRVWLIVSLIGSAPAFIWPEFNFVLCPLATVSWIMLSRKGWRERSNLVLAYLGVWVPLLLAWFGFWLLVPPGSDETRLSIGFDPRGWAVALGILLGKGVLPAAMIVGVDLHQASIPGTPPIPPHLDMATLWAVMRGDPKGFGLALLLWSAAFLVVLRRLTPRLPRLWPLMLAGGIVMLLPAGVVALSKLYQQILRLVYVQGALATAYVQVGFLTVVFAGAALLTCCWPRWPVRCVLAVGLGGLCTMTLAYNLLTRDAMAANQQRWSAFGLMAGYLPDGSRLSAPDLWLDAEVSVIPSNLTFGMANYWTERARIWHGKHIVVEDPGAEPRPDDARAEYGVRPDGNPIVLLRDASGTHLLAAKPHDVDPALTGGARWHCQQSCRLDLMYNPDAAMEERLLALPAARKQRGVAGWLAVPRDGGFGWRGGSG
jgi:hypothetical protein